VRYCIWVSARTWYGWYG